MMANVVLVHAILSAHLCDGLKAFFFYKVNKITKGPVISVTQWFELGNVLCYLIGYEPRISVDQVKVLPSSIIILSETLN